MEHLASYDQWLASPYADEATKRELLFMREDPARIEDAFFREIAFGTGGMRGPMGAGTNRVNAYTVCRATRAVCAWLKAGPDGGAGGVAIAYDTRNGSRAFAELTARTLCAAGLRAYLFERPVPTPLLSFTVRHHNCSAGIVLTASHNPKEDNGYKVYDREGCQLVPRDTQKITDAMRAFAPLDALPPISLDEAARNGSLAYLGAREEDAYLAYLSRQSLLEDAAAKSSLRIVYSPLHGTGALPVPALLKKAGFCDVRIVPKQAAHDGDFPTVRSPNPEDARALAMALEQAEACGADIALATDPDCDRIGVAARTQAGSLELLSGNQIGALLVQFILKRRAEQGSLSPASALVKTIVTGDLGAAVAKKHGLRVIETLTGFKYIGEQIAKVEAGNPGAFVMGYEESYGYLTGTSVRDKDGVQAALLVAEMAAHHKAQGRTPRQALSALYAEHGYFLDRLDSLTLRGPQGVAGIAAMMEALREKSAASFTDLAQTRDYRLGIDGLPRENVLKLLFRDGSWMAARPSGTEPKIKFYYSIRAAGHAPALARYRQIKDRLDEMIRL